MLKIIVHSIWLIMPTYVSNMCALLFGGGTPIDLGRKLRDGKRILGDGKTYRGFVAGVLCGVAIGAGQMIIAPTLGLPPFNMPALTCLSLGAMMGDITKSFFKRRIGLKSGAPLLLVDQLDFVAGALMLTTIFCYDWFVANFSLWIIITIVIVTPILHVASNIIGYKIGKKDVPW